MRRSVVAFGTIITASARGECVQRNENVVLCKNFFFFSFFFRRKKRTICCAAFSDSASHPRRPLRRGTHKHTKSLPAFSSCRNSVQVSVSFFFFLSLSCSGICLLFLYLFFMFATSLGLLLCSSRNILGKRGSERVTCCISHIATSTPI